jgi:predicted ribosome quality control (RQC) complex YloA/Tae2 family protein
VHGAAGSHVVLRRGKGKNEPSKATLEEVASWTAHFSQARSSGKVPVIYTRKKFVRRPRKAPPGLAVCTHEKTLIVRPREPAKDAYGEASDAE